MRRIVVAAVVALAAATTACTGSGGGSPQATAGSTAAPGGTSDARPAFADVTWEIHAAAEPCKCADGSPYQFLTRTADPKKVVLYFEGGGACFSASTCRFNGGTYKQQANAAAVAKGKGDGAQGIFDFANTSNPLADWSFVYVPYCTGDVHIGNKSQTYAEDLVVHHNGFVNAKAGLDKLVSQFADAGEVLVTGSSAGGVPSPVFGGLVADHLPKAKVTVLADGSGAYPDNPPINAAIGGLWGSLGIVPNWPAAKGLTVEQFSIPGLFVLAGKTHPDIRFARYDNAYDEVQQTFSALSQLSSDDERTVILANEEQIEQEGVPVESYLAPGTDHTILARKQFYSLTTNGVSFRDWFTRYLAGEKVGDVHCTDCGQPKFPNAPGTSPPTSPPTSTPN